MKNLKTAYMNMLNQVFSTSDETILKVILVVTAVFIGVLLIRAIIN